MVHEIVSIPEEKIAGCKTLNDALIVSWRLSGLSLKALAYELGESEKSLSRILRRNAGVIRFLDQEKLCRFIQACGNAAVPQFLAKQLGGEFVTKGRRSLIEEVVREVCKASRFHKNKRHLATMLEAAGYR